MDDIYELELFKIITERLSSSDMQTYNSLIEDYRFHRIVWSQLLTSLLRLFEREDEEDEDGKTQDDEDTDLEEGEIREDILRDPKIDQTNLEIRVEVYENPKDVSDERESEKYAANVFERIDLEGKKRGILHSDTIERSLMKTRTSRRSEQVTPSYRLIPEEEQCLVSDTVLNNKCFQMKIDTWGHKKLTNYEKEMAKCEEDMYEVDMLIEAVRSAKERAEKVMRGDKNGRSWSKVLQMYRTVASWRYG